MVEAKASCKVVRLNASRLRGVSRAFCWLAMAIPGVCQTVGETQLDSILSSAQEAQGRQDFAAAEAYRAAVRIRPYTPELWANLGILEYEASQYQAAAKDLAAAIKINPSLYSPNLFLGLDELRLDHAKEALPYLLKAEKLNDADP